MFQTFVEIGLYDGMVFGIIWCCFGDFFQVLELVGNARKDNKKVRIILCHIQLVIRNDEELGKFLVGVTIVCGIVLPNIH